MGIACWVGAEKVIPALRRYIEEHWMDVDCVTFKVDAFRIVVMQAVAVAPT